MKKKIVLLIAVIILVLSTCVIAYSKYKKKNDILITNDVRIVPTMLDDVLSDTAWCGTFQLVWNDMKNEVVKQDIVFNPQIDIVDKLNKEEFTENMISDNYYFKIYGLKSLELKKKIEDGIKSKFNQKSDILNDFDWNSESLYNDKYPNYKRYFFYSMLYREFEYKYKFNRLDTSSFGKYENIKYFGISKKSSDKVRDQITILYYNNGDDFALSISTKNGDQVIFNKNPKGNTFKEIYNNIEEQSKNFKGSRKLSKQDKFKAPYIAFNVKKEYKELEEKEFIASDGDKCRIEKAIQSISFKMDEKGGKVKSEAAMDMFKVTSSEPKNSRNLEVNDTFALFLKEEKRDVPYFAAKIENITKYQ